MSIDARVLTVLSELTNVPAADLRLEDDLQVDLGLDSIRAMELLALLSDRLGVEIGVEEATRLHTVRHVLQLARERHSDA